MNQKLLSKILATMLAVILTFANFVMLGVYATNSYATDNPLENQNTVSNNENVKFDAYFADEKGNKIHTAKQNMDANLKLYLAVQVEKGYLKNATIKMLGQDGGQANFKILNNDETLDTVESIDVNNNIIALKQINSGTNVVLEVPIASINSDTFDLSNFSKINNITLTGKYIDNSGKQIEIEKTINIRNEWKKEALATIEQATKTFIPFEVKDSTGTILQTIVKTGIENNVLPIKQSILTIKVPELNGKKPEEVIVTANNTYATNNQNGKNFTKENWNYDNQTGTITITVSNEPNENKVAWNKDAKDEYVITYIYNEKVDTIETQQSSSVTIEAYNNEVTKVEKENTLNIKEENNLGNFVTAQISSINELSKGYLYTRSNEELEYNENVKIEIGYANIIDKILVENNVDNFITAEEKVRPLTVSNKNYSYFKETTISKEEFETILGKDGYIKIIGNDGEQLAIFTLENKENEEQTNIKEENNQQSKDYFTYTYTEETNEIKIETSKPIKEGTIQINHKKHLKGNTDYSRKQIQEFQKLQLKVVTNVEYLNTTIESKEASKDIKLIEPSTKIEASVNKPNLSTIVKNEDVELRVVLKTNDITCDLYKNPNIEIVLPNYIKEINIKSVDLLFCDELKIKNRKTYVNDNGNVVIQVALQGEQTNYIQNEVSKGANLIVNTDITLKKLTPTKDDVMKVYVTNEQATSYENIENTNTRASQEKGYTQTSLNAVAPTGLVTTNTISGYNAKNETVTSVSGEEQIGKLDVKANVKTAKIEMNIINNYENKISNMKILGRYPKANNKDIVTNKDLGSNFNATIVKQIALTNVSGNYKIYYSTNPEATEDLSNSENGWTTDVSESSEIQSYLVAVNNYEMKTGDTLSLNYYIQIPENLEYGKSIYTNYAVYFDNIKTTETIKDKAVATKVGLTTGEGPSLEVAMKSNREEQVQEGSIVTYTISVKNTGKNTVNNVTVKGGIPEGTTYIYYEGNGGDEGLVEEGKKDPINKKYDTNKKEYSEVIKEIKPGEIKNIEYEVETQVLANVTEKQIQTKAQVTVENYEAIFNSQQVENTIIEGYLTLNMEVKPSYGTKKEGQEITYTTDITNVNFKEKENVVVTNNLPDGVSFVSANNDGVYDEATNMVTWNLGTINGKGKKYLALTVKINEFQNGQTRREITNVMNLKTSEKELKTNEVSFTVIKPMLSITQTTSTSSKVVAGDIIEYNVTIKNPGDTDVNNIEIKDYFPEGLKYKGATYIVNGKTQESWIGNTDATINIPTIKAGESVDITIKALVEDIEENKVERKIVNIVQLTADDVTKLGSNEVAHTIVVKEETNDPSTGEVVEGTYKITGLAWLDSNNDGKRDDKESVLGNIEVMLVNSETGKIVKDVVTGANKVQTTNEQGAYTFENLQSGKYLVVFFYDSENYGVTKYKAQGVIDSKNSDVVSMKVTLNGETKLAAVANSVQIVNEDITNIDMGLIKAPKFDLKLDKAVSKITVNNSKGTKTYEYNKAKLAKVDIKDKELEGTTVIIEYKITVTNEGETSGYAKKIVDYLPIDMKFNSELNPDWYLGESGNAYNASLANTLLQPGETKEITLVLTKKMTSDNTGTINNVAEIYEASNDLGLLDIDSSTANKVQSEDDISSADAIIGVKTGEVYVYTVITLISITILGIGIYFINKKVLRKM